jgi:hypothetical protein
MRTILIAHRDPIFAKQLAAELRGSGYHVIDCPGPLPPRVRCIRCDKGYCPLTEGADLMIYDPALTAEDEVGEVHNLSIDSALAHPDVPMLLAWSPETAPDAGTLRAVRFAAPWAEIAADSPDMLRAQICEHLERTSLEVR